MLAFGQQKGQELWKVTELDPAASGGLKWRLVSQGWDKGHSKILVEYHPAGQTAVVIQKYLSPGRCARYYAMVTKKQDSDGQTKYVLDPEHPQWTQSNCQPSHRTTLPAEMPVEVWEEMAPYFLKVPKPAYFDVTRYILAIVGS